LASGLSLTGAIVLPATVLPAIVLPAIVLPAIVPPVRRGHPRAPRPSYGMAGRLGRATNTPEPGGRRRGFLSVVALDRNVFEKRYCVYSKGIYYGTIGRFSTTAASCMEPIVR